MLLHLVHNVQNPNIFFCNTFPCCLMLVQKCFAKSVAVCFVSKNCFAKFVARVVHCFGLFGLLFFV